MSSTIVEAVFRVVPPDAVLKGLTPGVGLGGRRPWPGPLRPPSRKNRSDPGRPSRDRARPVGGMRVPDGGARCCRTGKSVRARSGPREGCHSRRDSRVAGRRCRRPAPSEPYVPFSRHTAQSTRTPLGKTRWFLGCWSGVDAVVTGGVEHHAVLCAVRAAVAAPDDVVEVPSCLIGEGLVADKTEAVLCFPQRHELSLALDYCPPP